MVTWKVEVDGSPIQIIKCGIQEEFSGEAPTWHVELKQYQSIAEDAYFELYRSATGGTAAADYERIASGSVNDIEYIRDANKKTHLIVTGQVNMSILDKQEVIRDLIIIDLMFYSLNY